MKIKQFAVIGLGRFGASIARTLSEIGHDVLVIDRDEEKISSIMDDVTHAIQSDGTNEEVMRSVGISNFDAVIISIGQNIQGSIMATLIAKELGAKYLVAKARNELQGKVLGKIGADKVVYPERDMGIKVAQNLVSENIVDFIELSPEYSIVEIKALDEMVGNNLAGLDLRAKYEINVLAIKTEKQINISPQADTLIKKNDVLIVVCKNNQARKLVDRS